MCGIGGILRTDGKPIPEEWLDAIDARIAWRGPDGHGRFRDRVQFVDEHGEKRAVEVAFVHRRLSIIDHQGGHQPMVSERGRNEREGLVAVVFNGCIYNHRELRKELEARGHRFVTDHSDTEVLIHGWREWDTSLKDHLDGMYAFALWDRNRASLLLERDQFGEKPLYFRETPDRPHDWFFASDAQCIANIDDISNPKSAPIEWLGTYLRSGYNQLDWTAYSTAQSQNGYECFQGTKHWPTPFVERRRTDRSIDVLLERAVASRLDADVPLGCFLSGGVDSSLVACFATKHKPDLRTFSVRMPDERYDESRYADLVARHLKTIHQTLSVDARPADDLVRLIEIIGQPFGDSSILPTYWVSKAAREHVKVALSGDGGDELFIGYDRYKAAGMLARRWPLLKRIPRMLLMGNHPKSLVHKLGRLGEAARDFEQLGTVSLELIFTQAEIEELTGARPNPLRRGHRRLNDLRSLREFDVSHYLPNDLLTKVDAASMACGLEVRCPFLDRDLASAALSMPIKELLPGGQRKGLLRRIARKYLPREIVDRPKMGFAIPIGEWFGSDYGGMKTLLLDHLNSTEPFGSISLNHKAVQRFIDEHMSGKRDHGQRLFTLLTLSIWAKNQKVKKSNSQQ